MPGKTESRTPLRLGILVGTKGRGSNLFAIHQAITETKRLAATIAVVIGSRRDAPALVRAEEAKLPVAVVSPRKDSPPAEYEAALLDALRVANVDTVVLAGFLRRLPSAVVSAFPRRILNIHPSLLPAFGGPGMYGEHVHHAVIEHGCKVSGCTVHFVDEDYDTGPIVLQRVVAVNDADTPEMLAARILPLEHEALVESLILLSERRLVMDGRRVCFARKEDNGS